MNVCERAEWTTKSPNVYIPNGTWTICIWKRV